MSFVDPKLIGADGGFTMLLVSKRRSGKSFMIRYVVYRMYSKGITFDTVILISNTALSSRNTEWTDFMDESLIQPLSEELLAGIIEKQTEPGNQKTCLLIFDDVLSGSTIPLVAGYLNKIGESGRHMGISAILSVQYPKHIVGTSFRNNIDYLLMSKNNRPVNDTLSEMTTWSGSKSQFQTMVDNNTNEYNFVLFNNTSNNTNFNRLKAKEIPSTFRLKQKQPEKKGKRGKKKGEKGQSSKSSNSRDNDPAGSRLNLKLR